MKPWSQYHKDKTSAAMPAVRVRVPFNESSSLLEDQFGTIAGWVAATLVRLGDLEFKFLPPDAENDS